MVEVIGINFNNSNRIYYFSTNKLKIKKGDRLVVETERGIQLCVAVTDIMTMQESKLVTPLRPILRIANTDDTKKAQSNEKQSKAALENAKKIAASLNLDMKFIDCSFTLDKNQLIYNFLADDRVDFRELAKKLAAIYKTRIELRQVGVRDKSKEIGGIGPCGRILCCSSFLSDFNSVSINMAKNQNISLNPTKINGICGRLLCCLNFEDDTYSELKKKLPKIDSIYKDKNIEGKVISQNILEQYIIVEKKDGTQVKVDCKNESNK